jgi:aryl sulfotransferase
MPRLRLLSPAGRRMTGPARILAPAARSYRGSITRPERWSTWQPRAGDILVCTPPKSGTTWTQTILAMLLHGGPDLPEKLPRLSPWIDADLGVSAAEVTAELAAQTGRRVVKTHTPADGFARWQDVTVIAVYRHPLDVFFSLRNHIANRRSAAPDHPMGGPVSAALRTYLDTPADVQDFDQDSLATLTTHYRETALASPPANLTLLHYSDMIRDPRAAVQVLTRAAGIAASPALIDSVTRATAFQQMKAKASEFAPVGGTGFWKSDAAFFNAAAIGAWKDQLSRADQSLYQNRLASLLPDPQARAWLEQGDHAPLP